MSRAVTSHLNSENVAATRRTVLGGLGALGVTGLALTPARAQSGEGYTALALQILCDTVNGDSDPEAARARMDRTLSRTARQVAASKGFVRTFNGTEIKLVVLPEYFLSGFPLGESFAAWKAKACIDVGGPEYEAMGEIAQKQNLFLAGNVYENDENFPEIYFQTSFVMAPNGDQILRYRRLISLYTPSPYDVWDRFLDLYGLEGVFPVAKTDIGVLGAIASEEILYPEVARCLAMRGAEIFCHSTSEVGSVQLTQKDVAKRARAIENIAYVVSANTGGFSEIPIPKDSSTGVSKLIDYKGLVMAEAHAGESMVANGLIDLGALRAHRQRTGMHNMLARQPFQLFAESYGAFEHQRPNALLKDGKVVPAERSELVANQRAVIERLLTSGILQPAQ